VSFADERHAIESRFQGMWANETAVKFENNAFVIPEPPASWVACFIRGGPGTQITLNAAPIHRYDSEIVVQVFVPEDSGTTNARRLADRVSRIFRRAQFETANSGRILCRTPSVSQEGVVDGWFQLNVTVPYIRDATFPQ
jgi:hypothetical protein